MAQHLLTSPKQYVASSALVIIPLGEPPLGVAYWWHIGGILCEHLTSASSITAVL